MITFVTEQIIILQIIRDWTKPKLTKINPLYSLKIDRLNQIASIINIINKVKNSPIGLNFFYEKYIVFAIA